MRAKLSRKEACAAAIAAMTAMVRMATVKAGKSNWECPTLSPNTAKSFIHNILPFSLPTRFAPKGGLGMPGEYSGEDTSTC